MKRNKFIAAVLTVTMILTMLAGCGQELVTVYEDWIIYEKTYIPATSGTNGRWGYSFAGDGGFVYIKGEPGTPARYEFFLKREKDGEIKTQTVSVDQTEFASYEKGDTYVVGRSVWVKKEDHNEQ